MACIKQAKASFPVVKPCWKAEMKWPLERKIKTEKPNNLREKYKK